MVLHAITTMTLSALPENAVAGPSQTQGPPPLGKSRSVITTLRPPIPMPTMQPEPTVSLALRIKLSPPLMSQLARLLLDP